MSTTTITEILEAFVATAEAELGAGMAKAGFVSDEARGPERLGVFVKSDTGEHCDGVHDRHAVVVISLITRDDPSSTATGASELLRMLAAYEPVHYRILREGRNAEGAFEGIPGMIDINEDKAGGMFTHGFDDGDTAARVGSVFAVSYRRDADA